MMMLVNNFLLLTMEFQNDSDMDPSNKSYIETKKKRRKDNQ